MFKLSIDELSSLQHNFIKYSSEVTCDNDFIAMNFLQKVEYLIESFTDDLNQIEILKGLIDFWISNQLLVVQNRNIKWLGFCQLSNLSSSNIIHFPYIGSTNSILTGNDLFSLSCKWDTNKAFAVTADFQTKGKGRLNRKWKSDVGSNIICSLYIPQNMINGYKKYRSLIPLIVSLSIYETLESINPNSVWSSLAIKWPNDLYLYGKKLGGILVETIDGAIVCGFGINYGAVSQNNEIDQPWARLIGDDNSIAVIQTDNYSITNESTIQYPTRKSLTQLIVDDLINNLIKLDQSSIDLFSKWDEVNCFELGQSILIKTDDVITSQYYQGIDQNGQILVSDDKAGKENLRTLHYGQVSVRADQFI